MFSPRNHSARRVKPSTLGTLYITVKEADDLPAMDEHALTDATVKLYLLPNRNSGAKRKTKVVKGSLNPTWEEQFSYQHVSFGELKAQRILEVTVWDFDRRGSNDFIGGLYLGPTGLGASTSSSSNGDEDHSEVSHWADMLASPGEWVEQWHTLRPSMDPNVGIPSRSSPLAPRHDHELSPVEELTAAQELVESTVGGGGGGGGGGLEESLPVVEGSYFNPLPFEAPSPPRPSVLEQPTASLSSPPKIEVSEPESEVQAPTPAAEVLVTASLVSVHSYSTRNSIVRHFDQILLRTCNSSLEGATELKFAPNCSS